jgi:hypothetical protein
VSPATSSSSVGVATCQSSNRRAGQPEPVASFSLAPCEIAHELRTNLLASHSLNSFQLASTQPTLCSLHLIIGLPSPHRQRLRHTTRHETSPLSCVSVPARARGVTALWPICAQQPHEPPTRALCVALPAPLLLLVQGPLTRLGPRCYSHTLATLPPSPYSISLLVLAELARKSLTSRRPLSPSVHAAGVPRRAVACSLSASSRPVSDALGVALRRLLRSSLPLLDQTWSKQ